MTHRRLLRAMKPRLCVIQAHREPRLSMRKMLHRSAAQDRALQKTKRFRLRILISSLVTDALIPAQ